MTAICTLSKTLNHHFQWNKARITCFSMVLISLLQRRTVNLTRLALGLNCEADVSSRYRRLQRFFSTTIFDYDVISRLIVNNMFFDDTDHFYLTMDRTNWQWGKSNINILMLGIVYEGQAIPVLWVLLNKKGNSKTRMRIALIKRFIRLFGKTRISGILGDREFIGVDWFLWLKHEAIPFDIRVKENLFITNSKGMKTKGKQLFNELQAGESQHLGKRKIMGVLVNVSALRLDSGELLILAHWGLNEDEKSSVEIYGLRWEIETLFGCLKGRGFNFEDTRLTHRNRIKKMVALLAIAFCWAHKTGEWRHDEVKNIRIKKHGRLAQSLFRYGLDWLDVLITLFTCKKSNKLIKSIQKIFTTKELQVYSC